VGPSARAHPLMAGAVAVWLQHRVHSHEIRRKPPGRGHVGSDGVQGSPPFQLSTALNTGGSQIRERVPSARSSHPFGDWGLLIAAPTACGRLGGTRLYVTAKRSTPERSLDESSPACLSIALTAPRVLPYDYRTPSAHQYCGLLTPHSNSNNDYILRGPATCAVTSRADRAGER